MTERNDWLTERRKHLGASEAAAVLGINPHLTALEVWISKCHPELTEKRADEDFLEFGTDVEPAIERRYVRDTGNTVYRAEPAIVIHPDYPELACTPDGLCDSPERIVVEYKYERYSDNFGEVGTDEIPDHFLTQLSHQMACTDRNRSDLALMHGCPPIRVYRARRDLELERILIDRLRAWWADYVVKEVEPPVTGDPAWSGYLARKYPTHKGEMVKTEDAEVLGHIESIVMTKALLAKVEDESEKSKNFVKAFIGEREGLICPDGTQITWRKSKDTVQDVTDWEALCQKLLELGDYSKDEGGQVIEEFTKHGVITRKGARKFILKESK